MAFLKLVTDMGACELCVKVKRLYAVIRNGEEIQYCRHCIFLSDKNRRLSDKRPKRIKRKIKIVKRRRRTRQA